MVPESRSAAVTLAATIDVIASPTEFPICARVLNTPPANACVRTGNKEVMARFEIVYKTDVRKVRMEYYHLQKEE